MQILSRNVINLFMLHCTCCSNVEPGWMHLTSVTRAEVETLLILNNATESSSLSLEEGGWGRGGEVGASSI